MDTNALNRGLLAFAIAMMVTIMIIKLLLLVEGNFFAVGSSEQIVGLVLVQVQPSNQQPLLGI